MAIITEINTHFTEAVVGDDGSLRLLQNSATGFKAGDRVLLAILPFHKPNTNNATPLKGTVLRYDSPFEPATDSENWEALRGCRLYATAGRFPPSPRRPNDCGDLKSVQHPAFDDGYQNYRVSPCTTCDITTNEKERLPCKEIPPLTTFG